MLVRLDKLAPRLSSMPGTGYGLGAALGPRSGDMPPATGEGDMAGEVTADVDEELPAAPLPPPPGSRLSPRGVKRNDAAREKDDERETVVLGPGRPSNAPEGDEVVGGELA